MLGQPLGDHVLLRGWALANLAAGDADGRTTDPAIIGPDLPLCPARQTTVCGKIFWQRDSRPFRVRPPFSCWYARSYGRQNSPKGLR